MVNRSKKKGGINKFPEKKLVPRYKSFIRVINCKWEELVPRTIPFRFMCAPCMLKNIKYNEPCIFCKNFKL